MKSKSSSNLAPLRPTSKSSFLAVARALMLFLLLALVPRPVVAGDAPAWMHALINALLPSHDEKTDAVLLYSEEILMVQPNGKLKEIDRNAYKILRPGGRHFGKVALPYDSDSRITSIRGWCIPALGKDFEVKDKDATERGYTDVEGGELVTDVRVKVISIPASEPGNIVGFEVEHEDRPYVLQDEWFFQASIPVGEARYTLQLPPSWEYKAVWLNHPDLQPAAVGNNQWQWIVKNVPEIKGEEFMPPWKGVAGVMIISLIPPSGVNRGFLNWSEMGLWYNGLLQNRRDASPAIKQKVAELIANRKGPVDQIRSLAEFMKKALGYVPRHRGWGGGNPHPPPKTLNRRFGDCKDKATLLASMLKELNIDSYHVVINTNRGGVTPATPPHVGSFNHAILAIHLPDAANDPSLVATIQHPKLGRLLFFDPTDELTPFLELHIPSH